MNFFSPAAHRELFLLSKIDPEYKKLRLQVFLGKSCLPKRGPVVLIGVQALDLVPKKAAGTAAGLTGLFGYMGGALFANIAIGLVVDKWGWDGGFEVIIAACILAGFFTALTWNREKKNLLDA